MKYALQTNDRIYCMAYSESSVHKGALSAAYVYKRYLFRILVSTTWALVGDAVSAPIPRFNGLSTCIKENFS